MTPKQQAVLNDLLENRGKPVSRAMLDAGYPPATAKNPQQLTRSKAWQTLMAEYLPDTKLLKVHQEGLDATKIISAKIVGKDANEQTDDFIEVPDHPTRHKFLESAYKLKGKLNDQANTTNVKILVIPHTLVAKYQLKNTEGTGGTAS